MKLFGVLSSVSHVWETVLLVRYGEVILFFFPETNVLAVCLYACGFEVKLKADFTLVYTPTTRTLLPLITHPHTSSNSITTSRNSSCPGFYRSSPSLNLLYTRIQLSFCSLSKQKTSSKFSSQSSGVWLKSRKYFP